MGIANKVINILVLIAAIGAAVCAVLLWQKREQITKGREILSEAIIRTVDKIGPKGQIQKDAMSIKLKADELKAPVSVLQENINKICKQRDEIAKAFADVVNEVNSLTSSMEAKAQIEVEKITDYKEYDAKSKEGVELVSERVNYYKQRSELIKKGLKELSAALELSGISDKNFWNNEKLGQDLSAQAKRAKDFSTRFHKYSKHILATTEELRKALGEEVKLKKPALGLDSKNWQKELASNMESMKAAAAKLAEFRESVGKLKSENEALKKALSEKDTLIKKKDGEITALTKELADAKIEIKRLKKIIDPSSGDAEDGAPAETAQQTDYTIVKKLVGRITYVNPTYGFVAIDLGTKSTVKAIGIDGKETNRIVALPQNAIMTVATSLEPGDAKYVARISVARIGVNSSIANVLPLPGSTLPKVGDVVFFSESDLSQMRAIREQELKLAAENAARENVREASAIIEGKEAKNEKTSEDDGDEKEDAEKNGKGDKDKNSSASDSKSDSDDEE